MNYDVVVNCDCHVMLNLLFNLLDNERIKVFKSGLRSTFLTFLWDTFFMLKSCGWVVVVVVAYRILVSAPVPFGFNWGWNWVG